jgi:hypothetical protein
MLLTALILHVVYFMMGYGSIYNISFFHSPYEYVNGRIHLEAQHALFGLILFIIIVIWLFHYLRNNPFKSYYPVSKLYLVKEFGLILIIFLSLVSIFHTFQYGRLVKMRQLSANIDDKKEADAINTGLAFLPHVIMDYEKSYSCEEEDIYQKKILEYEKNHQCADKFPERLYESNTVNYPKDYKFRYYCKTQVENGYLKNKDINAIVKRWINNHQIDSIEMAIQKVCKIADQYRIQYNIQPKKCAEYCFADTINYSPIYIYSDYTGLPEPQISDEINAVINSSYYMGFNQLTYANNSVNEMRQQSFWNVTNLFISIYIAIGLSVVLLLFRLLRFKPWIVGVLGIGVVVICGSILSISIDSFEEMSYIYFGFVIICCIAAITMISKSKSKLISAVLLIWFVTFAGPLMPIVFYNIYQATGANWTCNGNLYVLYSPEKPIHTWINDNWNVINTLNVGFILAYTIFLLIPLSYKWQANASE